MPLFQDYATASARDLRRVQRWLGTVHQQFDLVDQLRCVHNVNAGRLGSWPIWKAALSLIVPCDVHQVHRALERVGIGDKLDAQPVGARRDRCVVLLGAAAESGVTLSGVEVEIAARSVRPVPAPGSPDRRSRRRKVWVLLAFVAILHSLLAAVIGRDVVKPSGLGLVREFFAAAANPRLDPDFLALVGNAAMTTLSYAVLGTVLSLRLHRGSARPAHGRGDREP